MNDLLPASQLSSATVRRIDDGRVLCDDEWCDRLHGADPLVLVAGDEVMVCRLPGRQRGIVVGRIGGETRPSPSDTVIEAASSLALRCGEASLIMRADGRILISGSDIVSRAKRRNRIKGGSVAIN